MKLIFPLALFLLIIGCTAQTGSQQEVEAQPGDTMQSGSSPTEPVYELATFAGGCFWCMEPPFEKRAGVISVVSGYSGGPQESPSYESVSSGKTDHRESVQVTFDPTVVSYKELLEIFWRNVDPTDSGGQFVDRGFQYSTAIFTHNDEQRIIAQESKVNIQQYYKKNVLTPIIPFTTFYAAEDYHQDYYKKNPIRYEYYRSRSGRDKYLDAQWAETQAAPAVESEKPMTAEQASQLGENEWRERLTEQQYNILWEKGTEKPFTGSLNENKAEGVYVTAGCKIPVFSSSHKFDSGTGWPSFTQPISEENVVLEEDNTLFTQRTEVLSACGEHLGHVFDDGPEPTGKRYCINSAALIFIPSSSTT